MTAQTKYSLQGVYLFNNINMAGVSPPTKPPRTVKHPKESGRLLMTVIRSLSASESTDQRDREKAKLEKEYKKSDQRIDELISLHHNDLTQVMQIFGKLSARVTASREQIHAVKENLQACKMLLHCRRDQLKELWLEGVEHKQVLQLLDEIEYLREVPSQLSGFLSKKQYLNATKLLVSALELGDGNLNGIEALTELKAELQLRKQQLQAQLLAELSRLIYVESTQDVLSLKRQGSGRDNLNVNMSPFQRASDLRVSNRNQIRRNLLEIGPGFPGGSSPRSGLKGSGADDDYDLTEDIDGDSKANIDHFMAILIECLALLGILPQAVETLKVKMQSELLDVVSRTTRALNDGVLMQPPLPVLPGDGLSHLTNGDSRRVDSPTINNQQQHPLPELLETLLEQFRRIAASHAFVLRRLACSAEKRDNQIRLYEMNVVWSTVQAVMQLILTDYLDIQNLATDPHQPPSTFSEPNSDLSQYFLRRRPQRKRNPLFKFEHSTRTLSISAGLPDRHGNTPGLPVSSEIARRQREKILVCPPDPRNITLIYKLLTKFIEEIEQATGCTTGSRCILNVFLTNYIREVFLGRFHMTLAGQIESVTKSADAWSAVTSADQLKAIGRTRPLLQSTVMVEQCIQDLRELMTALTSYTDHFLTMVCSILRNYRETCQTAYRHKVQPEGDDKRIRSASWFNDDDFCRLIKSLPNWQDLQTQKLVHQQRHKKRLMRREDTTEEESPEDVRQRNMKEAEILASNLGEGGINRLEILSDVGQLRSLALLQESMEWFSASIYMFSNSLPKASSPPSPVHIDSSSVEALSQLAKEYEDLADTCLLVLHLEVRVQCFYYLLPTSKDYGRFFGGGVDSQEPDPRVLELTRVLVSMDEALSSTLQSRKCKYVFEGLGHLVAKILMSSAQFLESINESEIQKMCRNIYALQQTLTNITLSREVAMDHARHYFELFYLKPEEILSAVMEKGPQFTELEYMNVFQLISRSRGNPDPKAVTGYLKRLSDILGEVGVTV